ncbi:hypothetical protein FXO38_36388 [Capsicum annuum]|nr:hypothetical protein FXO38_36388 [Capsicum annuum]
MVGDFSEEDIESCILDYLGTVKPTKGFEKTQQYSPILFSTSPFGLQHQQVFLKDTDERACAYIAGPAPSRWGFTFEGNDLFESVGNQSSNDREFITCLDMLLVQVSNF